MPTDFVGLLTLLTAARARFVVVGGLAVVLHGFDRLTADVDVVIDLSVDHAKSVIAALVAGGYRSLAPVDPMQFADASKRAEWQATHGMTVFSMWDTTQRRPSVDLFVESPIPFETLYAESVPVDVKGLPVRLAALSHLIAMKKLAGRPQDLTDIELIQSRLARDGQ